MLANIVFKYWLTGKFCNFGDIFYTIVYDNQKIYSCSKSQSFCVGDAFLSRNLTSTTTNN